MPKLVRRVSISGLRRGTSQNHYLYHKLTITFGGHPVRHKNAPLQRHPAIPPRRSLGQTKELRALVFVRRLQPDD